MKRLQKGAPAATPVLMAGKISARGASDSRVGRSFICNTTIQQYFVDLFRLVRQANCNEKMGQKTVKQLIYQY